METRETLLHHATIYENLTAELEELEALLQLYSEHREEEEGWLTTDRAANAFVKMYLTRSRMADALLTVIQQKARSARSMAEQSANETYQKVKEQ